MPPAAREGEELYPLLTEKILSRAGEGVDSGYFIYQAEDRQICFSRACRTAPGIM